MKSHVVVNLAILNGEAILLERINGAYWKLPGGHVADNESPVETVIREAKEELDLSVEFVHEAKLFADEENATCLPTPFASFRHIVERDSSISERHANIIYVYAVIPVNPPRAQEGQEIKWFTAADLDSSDVRARVRKIAKAGLSRTPPGAASNRAGT